MQPFRVFKEHWRQSVGAAIDAENCRTRDRRELRCNNARDRKRPQPTKAIRQIAETFAEIERGLQSVRPAGADRSCPRSPNGPAQFGGKQGLVRVALVKQTLERQRR